MDYNFNAVLDELRKGADAEVLCRAFADQVNGALDVIEAEKTAASVYSNLADAWNAAVSFYLSKHKNINIDMDDIRFEIDDAENIIENIVSIIVFSNDMKRAIKEGSNKAKDSFETTMSKFFNKIGL